MKNRAADGLAPSAETIAKMTVEFGDWLVDQLPEGAVHDGVDRFVRLMDACSESRVTLLRRAAASLGPASKEAQPEARVVNDWR